MIDGIIQRLKRQYLPGTPAADALSERADLAKKLRILRDGIAHRDFSSDSIVLVAGAGVGKSALALAFGEYANRGVLGSLSVQPISGPTDLETLKSLTLACSSIHQLWSWESNRRSAWGTLYSTSLVPSHSALSAADYLKTASIVEWPYCNNIPDICDSQRNAWETLYLANRVSPGSTLNAVDYLRTDPIFEGLRCYSPPDDCDRSLLNPFYIASDESTGVGSYFSAVSATNSNRIVRNLVLAKYALNTTQGVFTKAPSRFLIGFKTQLVGTARDVEKVMKRALQIMADSCRNALHHHHLEPVPFQVVVKERNWFKVHGPRPPRLLLKRLASCFQQVNGRVHSPLAA